MNILVTGGAGFIGSHMVKLLRQLKCNVIVIDDLSNGHRDALLDLSAENFYQADFADSAVLNKIATSHTIDCVMHFAGSIDVCASMSHKAQYQENNVDKTKQLIETLLLHNINKFVFSSSAAVYGQPINNTVITEDTVCKPINPYGQNKFDVENLLQQYHQNAGFNSISLRYFNACGADPDGLLGERHEPETHLIPLLLRSAYERTIFNINGDDYQTVDGYCVRDFIHVWDVCTAHYVAMQSLLRKKQCTAYNVGSGKGYSIMDVLKACETITRRGISYQINARRPGDADCLLADIANIEDELGWQPRLSHLSQIISDAWRFYLRQQDPSRSCC